MDKMVLSCWGTSLPALDQTSGNKIRNDKILLQYLSYEKLCDMGRGTLIAFMNLQDTVLRISGFGFSFRIFSLLSAPLSTIIVLSLRIDAFFGTTMRTRRCAQKWASHLS